MAAANAAATPRLSDGNEREFRNFAAEKWHAFFSVRYFLQGGFLEGKRGFIWSILQCFWYRILVDIKIFEVYKYAGKNKENIVSYFKEEYGYNITKVG